eukprot:jgi/Botrbrau1/15987/Bobra.0375s0009.1
MAGPLHKSCNTCTWLVTDMKAATRDITRVINEVVQILFRADLEAGNYMLAFTCGLYSLYSLCKTSPTVTKKCRLRIQILSGHCTSL